MLYFMIGLAFFIGFVLLVINSVEKHIAENEKDNDR